MLTLLSCMRMRTTLSKSYRYDMIGQTLFGIAKSSKDGFRESSDSLRAQPDSSIS
jgi:hypothetical protein